LDEYNLPFLKSFSDDDALKFGSEQVELALWVGGQFVVTVHLLQNWSEHCIVVYKSYPLQ
jgi:hypothetical protein